MNRFLASLEITFRRDPTNYRPRVNKLNSIKDREQKGMATSHPDSRLRLHSSKISDSFSQQWLATTSSSRIKTAPGTRGPEAAVHDVLPHMRRRAGSACCLAYKLTEGKGHP
jgi:hypothetical protein